MDFVIQWLWYLLAFVAGSAAAGLVGAKLAARTVHRRARADVTGSAHAGAWQ
ncbi:channel accessory protein ArfB [Mycobacterium parmense]|uniref:Uncharacterized protein n=1 Tax=Mycobacterium parmense TaxID=185642 RepID=A0A7I7Z3Z5_9MYCO|nr:hypothetical protein [Mycobacterium parmense]MCV7352414.1 hypothetical protein [Mycobacterium parmense]BBZ47863.1 hypothetical protein MPRM_51440 [Mycobacterium parmense]